jgi:phosphate transport system substrate-binding protein
MPLMVAEPQEFTEPAPRGKSRWLSFWLLAIAIAGLTLAVNWFRTTKTSPPEPAAAPTLRVAPAAGSVAQAVASRKVILSLAGATTIGSRLVPELAKSYLKGKGATEVRQVKGARDEELFVEGQLNAGAAIEVIDIRTHGTATGFQGLTEGSCDIAMSVRKVKPEEAAAFATTVGGDISSNAGEHVLALDGVAFVVNQSNPIDAVKMEQLAKILSGETTEWQQLGGSPGSIHVFALSKRRATYDFVNEAILKPHQKQYAPAVNEVDDNETLAAAIAQDPSGIGFVGLAYIRPNKALAINDQDGPGVRPNERTVKTERYPLTRRLYLYTRPSPGNPHVSDFLNFVLGDAGQEVVKQTGFIDLRVALGPAAPEQSADDPRGASARWRELTAGAAELPTHMHFREGSFVLDARAHRDIGRIAATLSQRGFEHARLTLLGFSDSAGSQPNNLKLSQQRAEAVRRELGDEGLKVETTVGLGSDAPYTSNNSANGRTLNRRVEVWVKQ